MALKNHARLSVNSHAGKARREAKVLRLVRTVARLIVEVDRGAPLGPAVASLKVAYEELMPYLELEGVKR